MTILAQYRGLVVGVLGRHRCGRYFGIQIVPQIRHVDHARLARGARVVAGVQQLLEAGPVQQVAAVRDVARDAGRVDVLQAHGTVRTGHVLYAPMSDPLQLNRQAHVAAFTMEEPIAASYTTYAASVAVILLLIFIIKQVADQTSVLSKPNSTVLAFWLHLLSCVTLGAYQLCNSLPIEIVLFVFIMTVTADVHFVTAWSHKLRSPFVMSTAYAFFTVLFSNCGTIAVYTF